MYRVTICLSTAPYPHFQVTEGPDILNSSGVPVVLKHYVKTGINAPSWSFITPETYSNVLMEGNCNLVKLE